MSRPLDDLIGAIQFITVLPVGSAAAFNPAGMIRHFPVVGLIIGALVSAVDLFALALWSPQAAAVVDILFLVGVTGAFHIDGLGDTADGLFSHRGRQKALTIMKDSRVGVMGLTAIVVGLAVKWAGISGLAADRRLLLVLIPAYSRCAILFATRLLPYGRPDGGTGRDFFNDPLPWSAFWGVAVCALLSVFMGWTAVVLNASFFLVVGGVIHFYRKQMGCVTGDMLGALCETTESLLFLIMSMRILS